MRRIILLVALCFVLFTLDTNRANASWMGSTDVSGPLFGQHVWSGNISLTGDVMIYGNLEIRTSTIQGNGYRIINSGQVIINGYATLYDSRISTLGGSMQFLSGSLNLKTKPAKPTVDSLKDNTQIVTGTASPYQQIAIHSNQQLIGQGFTDINGRFHIEIPKQRAGAILHVTSVDFDGVSSEAVEVKVEKYFSSENYYEWEPILNVDPHKNWTIHVNEEVDESTIQDHIFMMHHDELIDVNVIYKPGDHYLIIQAPEDGYELNENYNLYIEKEVKSTTGKNIQPIKFQFSIHE